jgi:hypothetical protein
MAFITPITRVLSRTVSIITLEIPMAPMIRDMAPMPARAYFSIFIISSIDSNLVAVCFTV